MFLSICFTCSYSEYGKYLSLSEYDKYLSLSGLFWEIIGTELPGDVNAVCFTGDDVLYRSTELQRRRFFARGFLKMGFKTFFLTYVWHYNSWIMFNGLPFL